jgi:3-phosphoshikimate 1-carboxyvinyltransferase
MNQTILPGYVLKGRLTVPGDKSISHRALMLGAMAEGETHITNLMPGKDVHSTLTVLEQLGVPIRQNGNKLVVQGRGIRGFSPPGRILDAGNSGTTMRLMAGILAAQPFTSTLAGDASLSKRPMKRVITPLEQMGAVIESCKDNTAPLTIYGRDLHPTHYQSPVASAQVKSCVLLAGLHARGVTSVTEPALSRDHTERMLKAFGVVVHREHLTVSVEGPARLTGIHLTVPGDISAAAFFIVAASLIARSEIVLKGVGMNPTRTGVIGVLRQMGCSITETNPTHIGDEPMADLIVRSSRLSGTTVSGDMIPKLVDEIPVLAIAALFAEGETHVRNAEELRVKETDRIQAIETNILRMGGKIKTFPDGFIIRGPQRIRGAVIDSFHDHRIAMAFTVAGLLADGETVIEHAECAEISHPGFFDDLRGLFNV